MMPLYQLPVFTDVSFYAIFLLIYNSPAHPSNFLVEV